MTIPIGAIVCYTDEPDEPDPDSLAQVVQATDEEIGYAKTYDQPVGYDHGDVLVEWLDDNTRSWVEPDALRVVTLPK